MKKCFFCFLGILIFCAKNACAQEEAIDLGQIVVTASRMAQYDYKVTSNISVVTPKEIKLSNAQSVPEILEQELGINVLNNNTLKSATVDIRGFGDTAARNVLILIDERKINPIDISAPNISQIPLDAIERIEIIRGAGSVLYGDNAVGGVVNIITKKGSGNLKGSATFSYGSYDARAQEFDISGETKNGISYYLFSKYNDRRGYRENSDLLSKDFNARLAYHPNKKIGIDLMAGWDESDYGLPGGLSAGEIQTLGRKATTAANDKASLKDRFIQTVIDVRPWNEDIDFGHFVVNCNYRNRDDYDEFNTYGPFHTKRSINTTEILAKYIFNQTLLGREVNLAMGLDYIDSENDILGSGTNVDDITISKKETSAWSYAQIELLDRLFVNGGLRYQQAEYTFDQRNVAVNEKVRPDEWASMGGIKYNYAKGSNIHFNAQKTFRFLATDEWYSTANYPSWGITPGLNTSLKQQTGMQYELGIKHNFKNTVVLTVTPYWMDLNNEIFFDPATFANNNYDKTRRIGVEVGQETDILKFWDCALLNRFKFFTNYTYQHAAFKDGANNGKFIPMTPEHRVSAGVNIGFFEYFYASLIYRFTGSQFAINDTLNETPRIKPFGVLDLKVGCKMKNWEFFANVNNLAREMYYSYVSKSASSSNKDYFPAPERNFTLGLRLAF